MEHINLCSICFEEFSDPKIIPCFHTFCRDCLCGHAERVIKNGKFNCPVCRAVVEMPKNGVDGFQANFYINEMAKSMEAQAEKGDNTDVNTDVKLSEADLRSGHCPEHHTEKLTLYCEQCEVPCCRDCKIESHDGHPSAKLVDMSQSLLQNANEILSVITIKTERTQTQEMRLAAKLDTVQKETIKLKTDISTLNTAIIVKVEQVAETATQSLNEITEEARRDITNAQRMLKTETEKLTDIRTSLTQAMESNDPLQLLQAIPEAKERVDCINTRINVNRLFPGISVQTLEEPLDSHVKLTIGKVVRKKYQPALKGQLENVAQMNIEVRDKMSYIKTILPVSDTEAWIALRKKREANKNTWLRKLNIDGNVMQSFQIAGLINAMTSLSSGKVAVSMPIENKICVIEDYQTVFELAGVRRPMGMSSYENELFVCSLESMDLNDIQPFSTNRILVLSEEGLIKRAVEFFNGNSIFSFPGKISVNYNGDISVSDFGKNQIVCLGPDGKQKYQYKGEEEFLCGGVFFDDVGYLLVETSEGIHILDDHLDLVKRFTTDFQTATTSAVAVGSGGLIWVANKDNTVSTLKYYK